MSIFHHNFGEMTGSRLAIFEKITARCVINENSCWVWQGPDSGKGRGGGYGRMCLFGHTVAVHIAMYINMFGIVPGNKQIDHKCKNRLCCNPDHLEMVTHKQNQRRKRKSNARK